MNTFSSSIEMIKWTYISFVACKCYKDIHEFCTQSVFAPGNAGLILHGMKSVKMNIILKKSKIQNIFIWFLTHI